MISPENGIVTRQLIKSSRGCRQQSALLDGFELSHQSNDFEIAFLFRTDQVCWP